MPVLHLDPDSFKREYGILCHRYFPRHALQTPFGATYCVVAPGEATDPHQHHEGETFYIVRGRGEMKIAGELPTRVAPGDVVYIPAQVGHELCNLDLTDELAFFSVWWDDPSPTAATLPARSLIIAAPPTPNGDLHLGHLSGPYLAADVYARYLRLREVDVRVACGSDDNQSYTATKGRALGITPEACIERYATANEATLANMAVEIAYYLRPNRTPAYGSFVQEFLQTLIANGSVVRKAAPSLWCDSCSRYLYEAYVEGNCPHCDARTMGNGCEGCYRPNDCFDLIDPRCTACQSKPRIDTRSRWYFPLEPHREMLKGYIAGAAMSAHLRALAEDLLSKPLIEISVSHVADWGIPVPDSPFEVIYEWFEMAAGFLFQASQVAPEGAVGWEWAFRDPHNEVVQFFGLDNGFFFLLFLPAVLVSYSPSIRLPRALVANEFYKLDGQKFSTSRGHAVWVDEALEHVSPDALRFGLAHDRPEVSQTSLSFKALEETLRHELVGGWESWLDELDTRVAAFGRIAPALGVLTARQRSFCERLSRYARTLEGCYEASDFSLRRGTRTLGALVADARDFGFSEAQNGSRHQATALALEIAALRLFAVLATPLVPHFASRLLRALGEESPDRPVWMTAPSPLPAGREIMNLSVGEFESAVAGVRALAAARS